jgi:multidrug efflux system outer membrane protein
MTRIASPLTVSLLSAALLLQACAPTLPDALRNKPTMTAVPEAFPDYGPYPASSAEEAIAVNQDWHSFFDDPHLVTLIETALEHNQELNILKQEIAIANNEVTARRGEYLPSLGLGAGYDYEKVGEFTSQGVNDEQAGVSKRLHNRHVGLVASWEVDIWSKLRNAKKSAYYEYLASIEGRKFATTQIIAEIANSYYELLALDNQLAIIKDYIDTLQKAQEVVNWQKQAAKTTSLAVKRFAAEVLKSKSKLYEVQQAIVVTENRLNALVGRLPQPIARSSEPLTEITPQMADIRVPTDLLENRPDIKEASLALQAAELNVQSVKARFYPSLSIDAALGYEAFNSGHFLESPASLFYNIAAGLTSPLLNRMAIKADYFSANSRQIQAIYEYERTFIHAYTDVANQLASIHNLDKTYQLKSGQVNALSESLDIADTLFKAARIDYLETLLTQRDYLETRMEQIETRQQQFSAHIALYKALGGGWRGKG